MNYRRATVTGGAGFIGSHLVDALLEHGIDVQVVDDCSTGDKANLAGAERQFGSRLSLLEGSILEPSVAAAVRDFRPERLFHLAAQMNVRKSVEDPAFDAATNVVGTVRMLEVARECQAPFIFASTGGAIYGEQDTFPADEQHPIRPKSPYGVSKRGGELYLDLYGRDNDLPTTALRLGNVYGPRQNPKGEAGVVAIFITRLLDGGSLRVNGDGTQTRDFIFVGDVIRAFLLAADRADAPGFSAYNVGWGVETSVNDIVGALRARASDAGLPEPRIEYGPPLAGEQLRSVISPAAIGQAYDWTPQVDLHEGLARTLESFRDARD